MNWYYAVGGQQQGPIDSDQLDALVNAGTIAPDTLVWREGMANWQPLREVRLPTAAAAAAPPVVGPAPTPEAETGSAGGVLCCECGQSFPIDQVIKYQDRYVCANCKPVFLQRLAEGATLAHTGGATLSEGQILEGEYRIEIGECLERAWRLFTGNAGLIIGASVVVGIVAITCWFVTSALGLALRVKQPVLSWAINSLVSALYSGPMVGGYLWFLLRLAWSEEASIGDAFSGFRKAFGQLALASLVQAGVTTLCFMPLMFLGFPNIRTGAPNFSPGLIAGIGLALVLGIIVAAYVTTLWTYSLLLIIDKGYEFWPAMQLSRKMVSKRWWMTWLFLLVSGIISGAGVLACGIGLLVTIPLYFGMKVYLYEDNFRNLQPA